MKTKFARRSFGVFVALAMVAIYAIVPTAPSGANHATSVSGVFESNDGNLVKNHTGTGTTAIDWNDFWAAGAISATGTAWSFQQHTDATGNPDSIFGGGVKQDAECASTGSGSLGGGGSKFDLERLYLAHKRIGTEDYLTLAWVRVPQNSTTASSHVAFEFNQSDDGCTNGSALK